MTNPQEEDVTKGIKIFQRKLKSKGFDPGPVDGNAGDWTKLIASYYEKTNPIFSSTESRDKYLAAAVSDVGNLTMELNKDQSHKYCAMLMNHWSEKSNIHTSAKNTNNSQQLLSEATWLVGFGGAQAKVGDIFGVWYETLGRVGHCGLILYWDNDSNKFLSVEGKHSELYNPLMNGRPNVVIRRRSKKDIYCSTHIDYKEKYS